MAESTDFLYLQHAIAAGVVRGPVLEAGSYAWSEGDGNAKRVIEAAGMEWEGTDLEPGPGVDFTLDLSDGEQVAAVGRTWQTVFAFNLLEHVYDPLGVLRNVLTLVAPGGTLLVKAPAVWELHDYPADYWRPQPDFFIEFARREGCSIPRETFCWVMGDARMPGAPLINLVDSVNKLDPQQKILPSRRHAEQVYGRARVVRSRIVHKLFNTYGRDLWFPRAGIGVALVRGADTGAGNRSVTQQPVGAKLGSR